MASTKLLRVGVSPPICTQKVLESITRYTASTSFASRSSTKSGWSAAPLPPPPLLPDDATTVPPPCPRSAVVILPVVVLVLLLAW